MSDGDKQPFVVTGTKTTEEAQKELTSHAHDAAMRIRNDKIRAKRSAPDAMSLVTSSVCALQSFELDLYDAAADRTYNGLLPIEW